MDSTQFIFALVFILGGAGIMLIGRFGAPWLRRHTTLRQPQGVSAFKETQVSTLESGRRLHLALGSAPLSQAEAQISLAGLTLAQHSAQFSANGDYPVLLTSGEGELSAFVQAGDADDLAIKVLPGVTPYSYTAGTMLELRSTRLGANVLLGRFGPEAALLVDAAQNQAPFAVNTAGTDRLAGQAALFAAADTALVGEDAFVIQPALTDPPQPQLAVQDLLRALAALIILLSLVGGLSGLLSSGWLSSGWLPW